jgi:lycopene beta-cyclase
LAVQLSQSNIPFDKIVLIDQQLKNKNDRTWCFWTKEKENWFNDIVSKRWDQFLFKSDKLEKKTKLDPYQYCLIKGIDFYNYCMAILKKDKRFEWVNESIVGLGTEQQKGYVETSSSIYEGRYVFNSAIRTLDKKPHHVNYVQHFLGWVVETDTAAFDADCPVFMDFDIEQHNDCRFFYIIPQTHTKALVEYTGFSKTPLLKEEYESELKKYLKEKLGIHTYRILETEYGEVPMAESLFINPFGAAVINIGTSGGYSKPSTGYTFYFIQKHVKQIISYLSAGYALNTLPTREMRFTQYDKIFMDVIDSKKMPARDIFSGLFINNQIDTLLAFLNEESSYWDDFRIMNSVPKHYFIPSAIRKIVF